jgi:hypothetical protein
MFYTDIRNSSHETRVQSADVDYPLNLFEVSLVFYLWPLSDRCRPRFVPKFSLTTHSADYNPDDLSFQVQRGVFFKRLLSN